MREEGRDPNEPREPKEKKAEDPEKAAAKAAEAARKKEEALKIKAAKQAEAAAMRKQKAAEIAEGFAAAAPDCAAESERPPARGPLLPTLLLQRCGAHAHCCSSASLSTMASSTSSLSLSGLVPTPGRSGSASTSSLVYVDRKYHEWIFLQRAFKSDLFGTAGCERTCNDALVCRQAAKIGAAGDDCNDPGLFPTLDRSWIDPRSTLDRPKIDGDRCFS